VVAGVALIAWCRARFRFLDYLIGVFFFDWCLCLFGACGGPGPRGLMGFAGLVVGDW